MDPVTGAAAVGAGASIVSNVSTGLFAKNRMKQAQEYYKDNLELQNMYQQMAEDRQFKYNKELADYAFEQNKKMWQLENEYNSPSAQMQRYKEAGLNANLIYGNSNLSASAPSMSVGDVSTAQPSASAITPSGASFDFSGVGNSILQAQQLKMQKSVADADVRNKDADTLGKIIDNNIQGEAADEIVRGIQLANQKTESDIAINETNQKNITQATEKLKVDTELAHQEMIKSDYEIRITKARADIEELLRDKEKSKSPYYDQNAYYENKLNALMVRLKVQETQKMKNELDHWDEQYSTNMAYQASQILGLQADYTAKDIENRINQILNDPDFETDKYWSALLLNTMRNTSDRFSFDNLIQLLKSVNPLSIGKDNAQAVGGAVKSFIK